LRPTQGLVVAAPRHLTRPGPVRFSIRRARRPVSREPCTEGRQYTAQMTDRPSETAEGQRWIENFRPEDKQVARLLVDSLKIVSETTFRASLGQFLVDEIADLPKPVTFFPIRELPREAKAKSENSQPIPPQSVNFGESLPIEPLPLRAHYSANPGSEGAVGNVLRDVLRDHQGPLNLVQAASIADLRDRQPRSIVLVDDYCGSGNRAAGYVEAWARHRTIRSWHSRGLIRFHIFAMASSRQASLKLKRCEWIENVHVLQLAADFSTAPWSPTERRDIEALCVSYGQGKMAFGYENVRSLLAFQHTVPNTMPMVLWQSEGKHKTQFFPMFAGRRMTPSQQTALADYALPMRSSDIARSLRQGRLAEALEHDQGLTSHFVVLVLAASARGIRDEYRLGQVLSLPVASVRAISGACQRLNLLDQAGRLTEAAWNELRQSRRQSKQPTTMHRPLRTRLEPYYPYQLRDAGDV